ncbi:hypothetical protein CR164_07525 [Prosthecochloris marina]|uniref:Resolvase HTH domain-containing protein n=1 Tax=Prosthecochloris marina TaxID=2017681 RepID=A0A317T688_9CHLB|nr:hypothetical protein [Prosthecochloris marina]PWW82173.1 hypothetical protein CR164_07525 [Prosthecochloris marina]
MTRKDGWCPVEKKIRETVGGLLIEKKLAQRQQGFGAAEIARQMKIGKSAVYVILQAVKRMMLQERW